MDNEVDNEAGDEMMTIAEYMEQAEAEEENADLVLGGGSDGCTYKEGYMPRQAVFSCLTCVPQGNAGICTACSLTCHDGHEIIELWTKRQFRCDCGNSKFGANGECKLLKEKDPENTANSYNQNFLGLYCSCHHRYPDTEDAELGEMIQCVLCEDWFHEAHLGTPISEKVSMLRLSGLTMVNCDKEENQVAAQDADQDSDDEMICPSCVERFGFLSRYWVRSDKPEEHGKLPAVDTTDTPPSKKQAEKQPVSDEAGCSESSKPLVCKLKSASVPLSDGPSTGKTAVSVNKGWRSELCRCEDCCREYESKGVGFLLDSRDSMENYIAMAKQKRVARLKDDDKTEAKFYQNMHHVAKVEFLHGVKDMTTGLGDFLERFKESGKIVTSADVYEFFEDLNKKRRRIS